MNMDYPTEYIYVIGDTSPSRYFHNTTELYEDKEFLIEDIEKYFDREYYKWKEKVSSYKH